MSAPTTLTPTVSPPPLQARDPFHAIKADDLGVQYDLRFTKKTTLRRSIGQMLGRGQQQQFWALRHVSMRLLHGE